MSDVESIHELNADLFSREEVDRFSDPKEARKKAMDYLARREYGQRELVRKLITAGFGAEIANAEVEKLTSENLQDDRRFVESFAQSRVNQGKGPVRIQLELSERGLGAGLIEDVLISVDEDWFALAREIRQRKFGDDLPQDFKEKAKQMRFLQYRGFEQAHIQAAVSARGNN